MTNRFQAPDIQTVDLVPKGAASDSQRIEEELVYHVESYDYRKISKGTPGDFQAIRNVVSQQDAELAARTQRDARFSLNSASRAQLKIDEEERRKLSARAQEFMESEGKRGYDEGYGRGVEAGREEGMRQALEEFRAEAAEKLAAFDAVVREVESHRATLIEAQERYLLELVGRIARRVVLRELKTDRAYIERLLKVVLEKIGAKDNVRLVVPESFAPVMAELRANLQRELPELQNLRIEASPKVAEGCWVETQGTFVDASVERQIAGFMEAMTGEPVGALPPEAKLNAAPEPAPATPPAGDPPAPGSSGDSAA